MKKRLLGILICSLLFTLTACGNTAKDNNINLQPNSEKEASTIKKDIDKLNPFDIEELTLSPDIVKLKGWDCKTQMDSLETCRLMLSTVNNKSEDSFSFIGYAYEEDTNIPDGIFVNNTAEITNSTIYAVGLASGKEGQKKYEANPAIAEYKYSKTAEDKAVITKLDNTPIGTVKSDSAKVINERIEKFKEIQKNNYKQ